MSAARSDRPAAVPEIGQTEMTFLTIASYLGLGLFAFPREAAVHGHEGWLTAVLLALGLIVASAWAAGRFAAASAGRPLGETLEQLGGPVLRWAVVVPVAMLDILLAAVACAALAQVVVSAFLPETPYAAVLVLFISVVAYSAATGVEGMGRAYGLVIVVALGFIAIVTLMTVGHVRFVSVGVPRLAPSATLTTGLLASLYAGSGASFLIQLGAHCRPDHASRVRRAALWGALVVVGVRLQQSLITVGTLGLAGMGTYTWPVVSVVRLVSTHGFFLDRLGLFAVIISTASVWTYAAVRLFSAASLVSAAPGARGGAGAGPLVVCVMALIVFIIASPLVSTARLLSVIGQVVNPAVLVLGILLPIALWALWGRSSLPASPRPDPSGSRRVRGRGRLTAWLAAMAGRVGIGSPSGRPARAPARPGGGSTP